MSVTEVMMEDTLALRGLAHLRMDGGHIGLPGDPGGGRMVQAGGTSHAEAWQGEDTQREGAGHSAQGRGGYSLRQEVGISRDPTLTPHFSICFPTHEMG